MTKEEFYETFTLEEWELLCSVFVEEPSNAERAEAVANKILNLDSH